MVEKRSSRPPPGRTFGLTPMGYKISLSKVLRAHRKREEKVDTGGGTETEVWAGSLPYTYFVSTARVTKGD